MRSQLQSLLKSSAQIYLAQVAGMLVSFGISIVVARYLGPEGRGAYAWIMALHLIACQFTQLGTDTFNRRYGATHRQHAPALAANSLLQSAILGIFAVLAVFGYGLTQTMGQLYPFALFLGLLAAPVVVLASTWNSLAVGLGHAAILARSEITQRLATVAVVGLFLLTTTLEVWHLLVAVIVGAGAGVLSGGFGLRTLIKTPWQANPALFKHERNFLITAFGAGLALQLLQRMDILMLAAFRPLSESGHYAIAQTLMDAMLMLPGTVAFILMPKLAEEKEHATRMGVLLTVLAGALIATTAAAAIASLLAPWFIPLLFGAEFIASIPVFQRLMLAAIVFAGFTICQNAVAGTGRARHIIVAPLVGVLLKLSIGWMIIPHGMLAAANASILAYTGAFAVAFYLACTSKRPL